MPFNKVTHAVLSSQASYTGAERLFIGLRRLEGRERQSMLISALKMTEIIRQYIRGGLGTEHTTKSSTSLTGEPVEEKCAKDSSRGR